MKMKGLKAKGVPKKKWLRRTAHRHQEEEKKEDEGHVAASLQVPDYSSESLEKMRNGGVEESSKSSRFLLDLDENTIAGRGASGELQTFLSVFLPILYSSDITEWPKPGRRHLSLSALDWWIQQRLCTKLNWDEGMTVYKKFRKAYTETFEDMQKNGTVPQTLFRFYVADLCVNALTWDAFSSDNAYDHGFIYIPKDRSLGYSEWCRRVKAAEVTESTHIGRLLTGDFTPPKQKNGGYKLSKGEIESLGLLPSKCTSSSSVVVEGLEGFLALDESRAVTGGDFSDGDTLTADSGIDVSDDLAGFLSELKETRERESRSIIRNFSSTLLNAVRSVKSEKTTTTTTTTLGSRNVVTFEHDESHPDEDSIFSFSKLINENTEDGSNNSSGAILFFVMTVIFYIGLYAYFSSDEVKVFLDQAFASLEDMIAQVSAYLSQYLLARSSEPPTYTASMSSRLLFALDRSEF